MKKNNVFKFPTNNRVNNKNDWNIWETWWVVINYCEKRWDMVDIVLSRTNNLNYPYKMRRKGEEWKEVFGDNWGLSQRVVVEIKITKERFSRLCNMPYENFCNEVERLMQETQHKIRLW